MNKVVFNNAYGGYCLSKAAVEWLAENGREEIRTIANKYLMKNTKFGYHIDDIARHDPDLVRCVETLKEKADGGYAKLNVTELKGNRYRIEDFDGWEEIHEPDDEEYITIE